MASGGLAGKDASRGCLTPAAPMDMAVL